MLILFYSTHNNTNFSSPDHEVSIPLDLSPLNAKKDRWVGSLNAFHHWVALEISYAFEIQGQDVTTVRKYFLDEDGDKIILSDTESYREALKVAAQNEGKVRILVDLPVKARPTQPKAEEETRDTVSQICQSSSMERNGAESSRRDEIIPSGPPSWLQDCLKQVKEELRQELLESIHSSSAASVVGNSEDLEMVSSPMIPSSQSATPQEVPTMVFPATDKSAQKAVKAKSSKSSTKSQKSQEKIQEKAEVKMMMKKAKKELKKKYLENGTSAKGGLVKDCDLCCRQLSGPYFVCLSCSEVVCPDCVWNGGHASDHVLLRIPKEWTGKPKAILSQAAIILRGLKDSKKAEKTHKKKHHKDPLKSITLDQILGEPSSGKTKESKSGSFSSSSNVTVIEQVNEELQQIPSWKQGYGLEVVSEGETRLMDAFSENFGVYWKQWKVKNAGRLPWDKNVQLLFVFATEGVTPFAPEASVPTLQPGQQGDVVVWVHGPLEGEGVYEAHWQMQDKQAGKAFGQPMKCQWELKNKQEEESDREEYVSNEDESEDEFSLVTPGAESADYEFVPHGGEDVDSDDLMSFSGTPDNSSEGTELCSRNDLSEVTVPKPQPLLEDQLKTQEAAIRNLCEEVIDRLSALPLTENPTEGSLSENSSEDTSLAAVFVSDFEEAKTNDVEVSIDFIAPPSIETVDTSIKSENNEEIVFDVTQPESGIDETETGNQDQEIADEEITRSFHSASTDQGEEDVETEVKEIVHDDPPVPELARANPSFGRPNPEEKVVPPTQDQLQPDPVNQVLGGAFRAATSALDLAKNVLNQTSKAIQDASKQAQQNQQNRRYRWEPPTQQWTPATQAWTPQGTQTEAVSTTSQDTGTATAWWSPPPSWTPKEEAKKNEENMAEAQGVRVEETRQVIVTRENQEDSTESGSSPPCQQEANTHEIEESEAVVEVEAAQDEGLAAFNPAMETLISMGFCDVERNLELLRENNSDLNKVVDTLLLNFQVVRENEVPPPEEEYVGRFLPRTF